MGSEEGLVSGRFTMEMGWGWEELPDRERLVPNPVEGTNVLRHVRFDALDIFEVFYYRRAEVYCEIGAVVVAPGVPAFGPVVFMRCLVVHEGLDGDGV